MIAKRVFWVPKLGNFLKHPGTSENVPELPKPPGALPKHTRNFPNTPRELIPKDTRNFPKTPGTFQKHPELPRTSRELPKNTRVGGGWWVGGWVRTTPGEGPTVLEV